ncbi:hypothetical protein KC973_01355 [Candidatus Saccharibacteria bacterium]|nr:hypothetical protein [Candidatus Saccharibacteria bacterium]
MATEAQIKRSRAKSQRLVNVTTPIMVALFYWMGRSMGLPAEDPRTGEPRFHSIFFGDTSAWPEWVRGKFWPLDLLLIAVGFWVMFSLVMRGIPQTPDEQKMEEPGIWPTLKFAVGALLAFGSMFMVLGTMMNGWFAGLEFFVFGDIFVTVLVLGIGSLLVLMYGAGWLLKQIWGRSWTWLRRSPAWSPKQAWGRTWTRIQQTPAGRLLVRLGDYLDAKDLKTEEQDAEVGS